LVWEDASGASLGSGQQVVDQPSGTVTLVLPRSAFGTVGSGWVVHGRAHRAGRLQPRSGPCLHGDPQAFSFGVCPSGASNPICSLDPATVPKVMDTIPPAGTSQAIELDPTLGPVSLQGVAVP
jgi:glucoamylase